MKRKLVRLGSLPKGTRWKMTASDSRYRTGIVGVVVVPHQDEYGTGVRLEKHGLPDTELRATKRQTVFWSSEVRVEPIG